MEEAKLEDKVIKTKQKTKFGNLPGPGPGRPAGKKNKIDEMLKDFMMDCFEVWNEIEGKKKLIAYLKKNPRFIPRFAAMLQGFAPKTFLAEIGIEARSVTVMPSLRLKDGSQLTYDIGSDPQQLPKPENEA